MVLLLVFTLILASAVSAQDNPEKPPGKVIVLQDIEPGERFRMNVNIEGIALTKNYFAVSRILDQVKFNIARMPESSAQNDISNVYQYFKIIPEGMYATDLIEAELEFKIPYLWFKSIDLENIHEVALHIYDGGWIELETEYRGFVDGDYYFRANTKSFGYFAITAMPGEELIAPEEMERVEEVLLAPPPKRSPVGQWFATVSKAAFFILLFLGISILVTLGIARMVDRAKHPYPDLTDYIKNGLASGNEESKIRKTLKEAGWPKDLVDEEFLMMSKK
jgi:PGF-pre-PGF domain-containing protein